MSDLNTSKLVYPDRSEVVNTFGLSNRYFNSGYFCHFAFYQVTKDYILEK